VIDAVLWQAIKISNDRIHMSDNFFKVLAAKVQLIAKK